jgi:hypothetical protein
VTAVPGNGYVDVSWRAPASGGQIAGYRVQVSPAGGTQTALSATSVRVSGLTCSTSYGFIVASVGTNGETVPAAAAFAHPCLPPAAPTGLVHGDESGSIVAVNLGWNAVSSANGPVSYLISWSSGSQTTTALSTTVTGLLPGRTYTFTVRAVDGAGAGPGASASEKPGLDDISGVQMTQTHAIYVAPTDTSAVAWSGPAGWKYVSYCWYSGGQRVTGSGGSSTTWYYIVDDNGVFGWANSLWFTDLHLWADDLMACPSSVLS